MAKSLKDELVHPFYSWALTSVLIVCLSLFYIFNILKNIVLSQLLNVLTTEWH